MSQSRFPSASKEQLHLFRCLRSRYAPSNQTPRLEEIPLLTDLSGLEQDQRRAAVRLRKAQILAVLRAMRSGTMAALEGCGVIAMLDSGLAESDMRTSLL